jgi:hypothetical protein
MKTKVIESHNLTIKSLVKPIQFSKDAAEVAALCEPNECSNNCNNGTTLGSPSEEIDILF